MLNLNQTSFPYYGCEETTIGMKFCPQCGQDLYPDVSFRGFTRHLDDLSFEEKQERGFPQSRYCEKHLEEFFEFVDERKNAMKHVLPHWRLRRGVEMDEDGSCWWRQDWKLLPAVQEHRKVFWDNERPSFVLKSHQHVAVQAAFNRMS